MDWEKVGQAFQGGANVLAGGLMDRYQRGKDIEDWKRKSDYSADIERRQREATDKLQANQIEHRAFLESVQKSVEADPEMFPIWQAAQAGDERSQKINSKYGVVKHYENSGIPLLSEQIAELKDPDAPLPPGVRSRILQSHMTSVHKEEKERADLEAIRTRTERDKAMTKKALEEDQSGLYGDYAIIKKARDVAEKQKRTDIQSIVKEINSLNSRIMSKKVEAERAKASKTKAGFDTLVLELDRLTGLRDDALAKRDILKAGSAEEARQKYATEPMATPAAPVTPATAVENIALTPEDMKEIAAAKAARPDLSEEEIIKAYVAYKRKATPAKPPVAGLRER